MSNKTLTARAKYNRLAIRAVTAVRRAGALSSSALAAVLGIAPGELNRVAGSDEGKHLVFADNVWRAPR